MDFVAGDMADELVLLIREIARHPRPDSRSLAAYTLIAGLNERRDRSGLLLTIDASRQTLLHLSEMDEGIGLTKDVGGAVSGIRIGPHFANEWDILELSRAIGSNASKAARKTTLETVVHQTLIKGETRCWELRPVINGMPAPPYTQGNAHNTVPTAEVVFQIADLMGGGVNPETIRRCLTSLAIVIERGTQWGGRVELPGLGSFICQVDPGGTPNLVFRDGVG
jgi:hypothetical protein